MNNIEEKITALEKERSILQASDTYEDRQELILVSFQLNDLYAQQIEELKKRLGI